MMNRAAMGVLAGVAITFAAGHLIADRANAEWISDADAPCPDPILWAGID
jgi:hypothetical protein